MHYKNNALIVLFYLSLYTYCQLPASVSASPTVSVKTVYYFASGNTVEEIRADMDKNSPVYADGILYDAHTSWSVRWSFRWRGTKTICKISEVKVQVTIEQILPKLMNSTGLTESVRKKWKKYKTALLQHEQEHKDMAIKAAAEIESQINRLPAATDCGQLERDANRLGRSILKKYQIMEKELDTVSDHGMKQGAVFP